MRVWAAVVVTPPELAEPIACIEVPRHQPICLLQRLLLRPADPSRCRAAAGLHRAAEEQQAGVEHDHARRHELDEATVHLEIGQVADRDRMHPVSSRAREVRQGQPQALRQGHPESEDVTPLEPAAVGDSVASKLMPTPCGGEGGGQLVTAPPTTALEPWSHLSDERGVLPLDDRHRQQQQREDLNPKRCDTAGGFERVLGGMFWGDCWERGKD